MKNSFLFIKYFFFILVLFSACKKKDLKDIATNQSQAGTNKTANNSLIPIDDGWCVEDFDDGSGYDSILRPTVLGYHLNNHPYSLARMQQAYTNLYGNANGVAITNKYVRFKPSTPEQLVILDSLDIELTDYPLDYDIEQEGDYYDDGVTPAEEIPWLYAVVDANFIPPAGITYEVLEEIHVPTSSAVENEAFRITGNPIDYTDCDPMLAAEKIVQPNVSQCLEGYHWDNVLRRCVENNCPEGYHWDNNTQQCARDIPPNPVTRIPSGTITVNDNNFPANPWRPVRKARVVARRFLKIERTYTDDQGRFYLTKEFNKVRILAKFKNSEATVRALRRARLWQILFPVKRDFGKFKGSSLSNLQLTIPYNQNALSRSARYWAAATVHNTAQEYRDFAAQQAIGNPPGKLRILLTNWKLQGTGGAAPMFAKRFWQSLPSVFVTTYLISDLSLIAGGLTALTAVLKGEIDITAGYNQGDNTAVGPDQLSETLFHEQTHAAHYNVVGNSWWTTFVNAEITSMLEGPSPYGDGTTINASYIGLGESWAYHIGHFMTDIKYGTNSSGTWEQDIFYGNGFLNDHGTIVNIPLNAHVNLLEDFSPRRTNVDPFAWIPQGLYYDLLDNRNDNNQFPLRVQLNDEVSGFTNQQFFNALDEDITTLWNYRARLLSENGNSQSAGVTTIFNFYGY